jgi:galactokinase
LIDTLSLRAAFRELYARDDARLFAAPGRVNLIGEHTDYNDGFVFPVAIDRATVVAAGRRTDRHVRIHSRNLNETISFDLDHPGPRCRGLWIDYVEGIAQALKSRGAELVGADLMLESDVPVGSGLSSSAALEVSVGLALLSVSGAKFEKVELALAGQQAEHTYVGIKCGIMDQLIAVMGQKGYALLIDCRSLDSTLVPLDTSQSAIVVCDSHVKHELASSEYNRRREQCEKGVEILRVALPGITALRDVSEKEFEKNEHLLPDLVKRRCRHVVTENARTLSAVEALRAGNLQEFGRLMVGSHNSLRDDYEVSCVELDSLVNAAMSVEGVAGARMTGGGFGGCTVNIVSRDSLESFKEVVTSAYRKATGRNVSIYVAEAGDGARELL